MHARPDCCQAYWLGATELLKGQGTSCLCMQRSQGELTGSMGSTSSRCLRAAARPAFLRCWMSAMPSRLVRGAGAGAP